MEEGGSIKDASVKRCQDWKELIERKRWFGRGAGVAEPGQIRLNTRT